MSIDQIVLEISKFVIPALPYIIGGVKLGGKKAAEKLGEVGASKSVEFAEKLWGKLTGKKQPSRKLSIAAKELSKTPKDKEWQGMLKKEMKLLLEADPALLKEITHLLKTEAPVQIVRAEGNVNARVEQKNSLQKGEQVVVAKKNKGLIVRQTIEKK